jgi:hypothetical protein
MLCKSSIDIAVLVQENFPVHALKMSYFDALMLIGMISSRDIKGSNPFLYKIVLLNEMVLVVKFSLHILVWYKIHEENSDITHPVSYRKWERFTYAFFIISATLPYGVD